MPELASKLIAQAPVLILGLLFMLFCFRAALLVVDLTAPPGGTANRSSATPAPIAARKVVDIPSILRANMFGRARIIVRDHVDALVVPKAAVQWEGCCNVVFVRQTDTVYQPYRVQLGEDLGETYVVLDGLDEGELVVTQGSFLLKTEILKGSIGAGCCEVHGASES